MASVLMRCFAVVLAWASCDMVAADCDDASILQSSMTQLSGDSLTLSSLAAQLAEMQNKIDALQVELKAAKGASPCAACDNVIPSFAGADFVETMWVVFSTNAYDKNASNYITPVIESPGMPYKVKLEKQMDRFVIFRRNVSEDNPSGGEDQKQLCVFNAPLTNFKTLTCVEAEAYGQCDETTCLSRTYTYVITELDSSCHVLSMDMSGTKPLTTEQDGASDSFAGIGNLTRSCAMC